MKWVWVIGCFFLVLLCIAFAIWIILPGKSVLSAKDEAKALKSLLGRSPHLIADSVSQSWITHKSQYVQFEYPTRAKVYTEDNKKAVQKDAALDSFSFTLLDDHLYGVVQVISFEGRLSEYSAVNLRLLQNTLYTPLSSVSSSMDSVTFSKQQDMVEKSAFFQKQGKVVSVAITGYSGQKVDDLFQKILLTLKIF